MKLADDFLSKCLNYQTYFDEIQKSNQYDFVGYRQSNYTDNQICNQLFIVEEKDYDIAIELCKEYKRSIQKKAYQHQLNQLKETGAYCSSSGNAAYFITELRNALLGRSRSYTDKGMLVEQDLKTHFPEMEEIKSAYELLNFVRRTKEVQKRYADAQNDLRMHQTKIQSIHDGTNAGKSVLEIVEQLNEHEQD